MSYREVVESVFLPKMLTMFVQPRQLETEADAKRWLQSFVDVVAMAKPSAMELEEIWARLVRSKKTMSWPMPAEVYELLVAFRGTPATYGGEAAWAKRHWREATSADEAEQNRQWWARRGKPEMSFGQALNVCQRKAAEGDVWFKKLLAMGEAFDKQDHRP